MNIKKKIVIFGDNNVSRKCFNIIKKNQNYKIYFNPKKINQKYHLGFSIKHNKIFKEKEIKMFSKGIINFHNGELPKFKGMYSIYHTLRLKNKLNIKFFFITLHFIDKNIDNGDIIQKIKLKIDKNENAFSLYKKSERKMIEIFKKNYLNLINKKIKSYKQKGKSAYYNKKSIDHFLNLSESKKNIECHIRSLYFPGKNAAKIKVGNLTFKLSLI